MSRILAINGDVDDGSHLVAVVPLGTDAFHHLLVAHANHLAVHFGTDTLSCNLLYIGYLATICCFLREGSTQGCSDRVSGEMLGMSRQMQQNLLLVRIFANMHVICIVGWMVWAGIICMNSCHGKLSVGQSSGLVEHNGSHLSESIHIVAALDENTVPGCSADAAKEGEGHADDQGARTGNYQEYQGTVEP